MTANHTGFPHDTLLLSYMQQCLERVSMQTRRLAISEQTIVLSPIVEQASILDR